MVICKVLTKRGLRWIHNSRSARILHIFDEVCNLINDQGDVISLASLSVVPGPFTFVMESGFKEILSTIELTEPITIATAQQSLSIGPLVIATKGTPTWHATPHWSRLQKESGVNWPESMPLSDTLETQIMMLLRAIIANDFFVVAAATSRLAGLGQGVTPTGDDILMGLIFALWIWHPKKAWIDLIVDTAVPRTTSLSAAFLRAAGAGEATMHWHDLVNGLPDAPSNILDIGHSSGADAWAGFTLARDYLFVSGNGCQSQG